MTQEQISELFIGCCQFLSVEKIAAGLHEGLEDAEVVDLQNILIDFNPE